MAAKNSKPLPRINAKADVMADFIHGQSAESSSNVSALPSSRPAGQPDARPDGMTRVMTATLPSDHSGEDATGMAAIRAARRRRAEPEPRTVKTTVRLPERVAKQLRLISIEEGVTMTAIAENVLRAWVQHHYDGGLQSND